jgi:hypothetical protein
MMWDPPLVVPFGHNLMIVKKVMVHLCPQFTNAISCTAVTNTHWWRRGDSAQKGKSLKASGTVCFMLSHIKG